MDNSPLKKLPTELRIYIYELALYQPDKIHVIKGPGGSKNGRRPLRAIKCRRANYPSSSPALQYEYHEKLLALPFTCKQIRNEAMPAFVQVNRFVFSSKTAGVIKSLRRWTPRLIDVEIALESTGSFRRDYDEMMERLIRFKKLCAEVALQPKLTVNFSWSHRSFATLQAWFPDLVVRFDQCDKDSAQRALDQLIEEAKEQVTRPQPGLPLVHAPYLRGAPGRRDIEFQQQRFSALLTALDEHPKWSWG